MRKPTANDIAHHLNISPSTVSRVLNGSPLIKEDTRLLVEAAAKELGYQKRHIRRHGQRSVLVIGLFLPRSPDSYRRLFYDAADLIAGLTEGFQSVRTQISISVNHPKPELFSSKKSGNVDACVFGFSTPTADVQEILQDREIPTVLLNRESADANYVSTDHLTGFRALLRRAGSFRSRIVPCYLSFTPAQPIADMREAAFIEACEIEGVPFNRSDIIRIDRIDDIDTRLVSRVADSCNTVFCFNDFVAVYFYQVALVNRLSVPEHLGIAGYDDSPVRYLTPQKIDTVSLSSFRLGREAGSWLNRIIIERISEPLQLRIPGQLIPGETLCCGKNRLTQE